ncbi:hypothetical protein GTA08_BOTSDO02876 [Neofusicoccum parvum]|nr:hypothetical protein GTA08_BOTSDO02876 [Neofusicoccum parvum]
MDAKQCDPVYFDPHGDVCLLVQDESDKDKVGRFIVSSKALTFACEAWNRMLGPDGHFMEAQPIDGMREIPLSDNPSALAILLNIAHLRFKEVPRTLSFDDLLEVSVLTDRYGATTLVKPWVADWIKSLENTVEQYGNEEWL